MTEPTTIRDALEAAVPQDETNIVASQPVEQVAASEPGPVAQEPVEALGEAEQPLLFDVDEKPEASKPEAPKPEAKTEEGVKSGPKPGPKPAEEKAPASWKPELREQWGTLPQSVRSEITRREREVQKTLKDTSEARNYADAMSKAIAPYEMFIQSENSNHVQAVQNVMATAAKMRTAPAPALAHEIAQLVKHYGVGRFGKGFIEQLDQALVGEVPQVDPQIMAVQQAVQQQMAPVQQFMSQFQQAQMAQQQMVRQEAQGEVQDFLSQAEFANDVREDMADLMEVAQRRGRELSLQEAYRQACLTNPQVRKVLEGRQKAAGGQRLTEAAVRAKQAAVSVTGSPAMAAPQGTAPDIRGAIEAALAAHSR